MSKRPKYEGPDQKLVLALDVGTTFSGISYAYVILRQAFELSLTWIV